ncbi:uncharacterized protein EV422DRAFT_321065 [Fimicolochytrium jonesii]|uniref:uncharacterized protein n=1 Tax=Fimicolochytrium jonesii TaxID=1396493 RepID=UPI0022FE33CC|nr:uncharacterized protein EV422DRAFT_321065 [Fimicolochytrium jonesii]KAI8824453.1 hypothetical protein EV422DRAFT_321065 [Fimicolochytrium jonesii]
MSNLLRPATPTQAERRAVSAPSSPTSPVASPALSHASTDPKVGLRRSHSHGGKSRNESISTRSNSSLAPPSSIADSAVDLSGSSGHYRRRRSFRLVEKITQKLKEKFSHHPADPTVEPEHAERDPETGRRLFHFGHHRTRSHTPDISAGKLRRRSADALGARNSRGILLPDALPVASPSTTSISTYMPPSSYESDRSSKRPVLGRRRSSAGIITIPSTESFPSGMEASYHNNGSTVDMMELIESYGRPPSTLFLLPPPPHRDQQVPTELQESPLAQSASEEEEDDDVVGPLSSRFQKVSLHNRPAQPLMTPLVTSEINPFDCRFQKVSLHDKPAQPLMTPLVTSDINPFDSTLSVNRIVERSPSSIVNFDQLVFDAGKPLASH